MHKKVILITEIISPYRIPVFNELRFSYGEHFFVLFLSETVKEREWKVNKNNIRFAYKILPSISLRAMGYIFPFFFNPTIFFALVRYCPDIIIIGGYQHPSYLLALCYAKLFKKRIVLWCESNKYDIRFGRPLIEKYKRWFLYNCNSYIAAGSTSSEYLIYLGAVPQKILIAPNAVDNNFFDASYKKYKMHIETFKKSRNYPKKIILYVGRIIAAKGVLDLIQAFQTISLEMPDLGLLIVGDGPDKAHYMEFCKIYKIKNVFFEGFIQQEELACYYAVADVFVLPTHSDPWGLVLNEAMACRLPVISSDVAGAAYDLIKNGRNGYIFKKGDVTQLTAYLKDILNDDRKRAAMAEESYRIIQDYSPEKCAQGFIHAITEI